ncbi:MAG: beta-ketoacyl-ACP synthase II [Rickettsiaceae bacterium]|jgi:3-oxoacyl-[acyl-carrier-protein] synthase II|nr:beta-ketoacyl-ACP synthase II [Rickettsiaceae bacterium]
MSLRRVVITGVGAVTSLGHNVPDTWSGILSGKSGVKVITEVDTSKLPCKIASMVSDFDPEKYVPARELRKMDRFIHFGLVAAIEAIADSGWKPKDELSKERTGVMIGSGIGGLGMIERTSLEFHNQENPKVSPYFIPASLINLISGHISIMYGFSGPNSAVVTACSTGAHAIGDAARMIKYGDADVMVAGGAEAPVTPVGMAGFASARTLAIDFNDNPTKASRPWDKDHAGFVMGEGSGIVVLEEYEHALKRGAKIYAEVCGYGLTGDAFHMTSPSGRGAFRAMENALKDAKVRPEDVSYINAHATSTKAGDPIELIAVQTLFEGNKSVKMSSTKSSIGHLLGAAGSVEAIFAALAIRDQVAPPTLNLHNPIDEAKINLVPLVAQETKIEYVLSNSFGFGGTNASLLLRKI